MGLSYINRANLLRQFNSLRLLISMVREYEKAGLFHKRSTQQKHKKKKKDHGRGLASLQNILL